MLPVDRSLLYVGKNPSEWLREGAFFLGGGGGDRYGGGALSRISKKSVGPLFHF